MHEQIHERMSALMYFVLYAFDELILPLLMVDCMSVPRMRHNSMLLQISLDMFQACYGPCKDGVLYILPSATLYAQFGAVYEHVPYINPFRDIRAHPNIAFGNYQTVKRD